MKQLFIFAAFCPMVVVLAGCMQETEPAVDIEDDETAAGALVSENALAPNALAPNALAPNALAPNALAPNALVPSALAALQATSDNGDLARQLVKYTVSCAFEPTQSFTFSWTDTKNRVHNEVYPGLLGIAPGWATAPLTDDAQRRLLSGCLAARVNWYGTNVVLSMRSHEEPLKTHVQASELAAYPNVEGAFWGNLFAATPYLNACYYPGNEAIARAAYRDCAVGHLQNGETVPCGLIALRGSCSNWCFSFVTSGQHYTACWDDPGNPSSGTTNAVITVGLP